MNVRNSARRITMTALSILTGLVVGACGGDDVTGPAAGSNLSFTLNGATVAVNAKWTAISATRYRISWEEGTAPNYKNIEIDLYGNNTPGNYTVKASPSATGDAGFQYYVQSGGTTTNYQGISGTIVLTSASATQMSGTFTLIVTAGGISSNVTNGVFTNVPKM